VTNARLLDGVACGTSVRVVRCERLLAKDVFARSRGRFDDGGVRARGRTDVDDVDVVSFNQFMPILDPEVIPQSAETFATARALRPDITTGVKVIDDGRISGAAR